MSATSAAKSAVRVFVSYSWDSELHRQRVLSLVQRLRDQGVDAWIDRFVQFPPEGWQRWMENEIEKAQFVLLIITEAYRERFTGHAGKTGLGVSWEGAIVTADLYDSAGQNVKFVPTLFSAADEAHVPRSLRRYSRFRVDNDSGFTALCRLVTDSPEIMPAPLRSKPLPVPSGPLAKVEPLSIPTVHSHAAVHSNLPHLAYGFFGREGELQRIASALSLGARTWGALIDGPGGIGKTALAIRAAETTAPGQFQRIIFLSAKSRELTPSGPVQLANFVVPTYLNMLNELARQLDRGELTRVTESERPTELQRALQEEQVLLIFDNLESVDPSDRVQLFDFLAHLPSGCKAIVTSRRRDDTDARIVRLGKLSKDAALEFISRLAEDRDLLRQATTSHRVELYENTGGNPLLIRWIAGQLGRGYCKSVPDALNLLRDVPTENDPLEFVFGHLAQTFTESELTVLAVLSHFTSPIQVKAVAKLGGLSATAAQTALENLNGRSLVSQDAESNRFSMLPLVTGFLRKTQLNAIEQVSKRLIEHASVLVVENGYKKYSRFSTLELAWDQIGAAIPFFVVGDNSSLQNLCSGLSKFFEFSGRWDELISLYLQAEARAVASKDFLSAAVRALDVGYFHSLRKESAKVLACSRRAEKYLRASGAGANERASVLRLRGVGFQLAGHYSKAIKSFNEAITLWRNASRNNEQVAIGMSSLASAQYSFGDRRGAEKSCREALRIFERLRHHEGVAACMGNLANLADDNKDWRQVERLAKKGLRMARRIGRKELVASNSARVAKALQRQGKYLAGVPFAEAAVSIFSELRSPSLEWATDILDKCQRSSD